MSPFQRRLTRLGLKVLSRRGFALAGGYALQEHGFGDRWSDDVDLFTPFHGGPADAAPVLVQAYEAHSLAVAVEIIGDSFARLRVREPDGGSTKIELCSDWRTEPPVIVEGLGAVLGVADAVAGKMSALSERHLPRDFIDIDAVLRSGRLSRQDLLRLAWERDPGFDRDAFAEALAAVRFHPDAAYTHYDLDLDEIGVLRVRFAAWRSELL